MRSCRKAVAAALLASLFFGVSACGSSGGGSPATPPAPPSPDPLPKNLLYPYNFNYLGAFRVPSGNKGFAFKGSVLTYNPVNDSLFMGGSSVAEISIPAPVLSNNLADLNVATVLQDFTDISEGNLKNIGKGGAAVKNSVRLGGLLVSGNKLLGTSFVFFDAGREAERSHFTSGLDFSITGDFQGMFQVGEAPTVPNPGFVSGWMAPVPSVWQNVLGGNLITGNGGLSVLSRTSYGPAAFAINVEDLGVVDPVPATALFYYPKENQTLGVWDSTNPNFNATTKIAGMIMPEDSRSLLYFGYHGLGQYNYGQFNKNPIYADICTAPDVCETGPKGFSICSDPANCTTGRKGIPNDPQCWGAGYDGCYYDPLEMGNKGPHAYPYVYQVWAYDLGQLQQVKAGEKQPWEVLPYAIWTLPFDVARTTQFGGAAAYDAKNDLIYISQPEADLVGSSEKLPLVHVFKIDRNAQPAASFKIGGTVLLLNGSVTLSNDAESIVVNSTDRATPVPFSFNTELPFGGLYDVTVTKQPADKGQNCKIYHGKGTVQAYADISNIVVYCSNEP